MSYEATYSSSFDTRLVSQSSATISAGILSLASSIRDTAQQGTRMMDEFMNRKIKFPCSIVELKTELKNNIIQTVKENPNLSVSQCYMNTLTNHSIMKNIISQVPSFKTYHQSQKLTGRKLFTISEQVLNECITEVERTFVDVKTVLTVQAFTTCGFQVVKSNSELTSQTLIAQNNEGTVLVANIQPDKMMMDTSGLRDSSCKKHVQVVLKELNKLGIKINLENENEHRKRGGGTLLSFGTSASLVHKAAKIKGSLKKNLSFQTNVSITKDDTTKNYQREKKRERS